MDDDDDFDMFAPPVDQPEPIKPTPPPNTGKQVTTSNSTVLLDHSDAQGYFHAPVGTVLKPQKQDCEYQVCGTLGQGVFSTVFLAKRNTDEEFAVKILRANETMYKAGQKEIAILKQLSSHAHVVRLLDSFELFQPTNTSSSTPPHMVLVFERMGMNLRETMDKFGRNVGLSIQAVRIFALQLFSALATFKEMGLVHADLKPDNIMVSQDFRRCAVGDLGSAFYMSDAEALQPTPYLVSRFYRAPEIVLGLQAVPASDVWSLGVLLYELFAGTIMFPGNTNNDMLNKFHFCLGRFPKHMLRKHCLVYENKLELEPHYDSTTWQFKSHEVDHAGKIVRRLITVPEKPEKSIWARLVQKATEDDDEDAAVDEDLLNFSKLLVQCLTLDPEHRLDPTKASRADFFKQQPGDENKRVKVE